jgi:hypothetical protein
MPSEEFFDYIQDAVDQYHFDGAPWTDSLSYYDTECMLLFDDAGIRSTPIWAANYKHGRTRPNVPAEGNPAAPLSGEDWENIEWFQEEKMPVPQVEWDAGKTRMMVSLESDRDVPWGAAWWDNLAWQGLEKASVMDATAPARAWLLDHKVLFLRANLPAGSHQFQVEIL